MFKIRPTLQLNLQSSTKFLGTIMQSNESHVFTVKFEKSAAFLWKTHCCPPSPPKTVSKITRKLQVVVFNILWGWSGSWSCIRVYVCAKAPKCKFVTTFVHDFRFSSTKGSFPAVQNIYDLPYKLYTCFLHLPRVYCQLTKRPSPSWLDSSVGRALNRYHGGHGFESR